MIKTVCIAGLGLMGGSMAKAISEHTDCAIYGWNRTRAVTEQAIADGVLCGEATDEVMATADLVIVGLFPNASVAYMRDLLPKLKKGCILIDMVGVKRVVVDTLSQAALDAGVLFIGGHPMAGMEVTGYTNSTAKLYQNASMILVPTIASTEQAVEEMSDFFLKIGFGRIRICSAGEHDRMIAFTSQLAHVVSNAFVKNDASERHVGFSAGSYRDLTRVAKLDAVLWQELFLLNDDALLTEIDEFLGHMQNLRGAIAEKDSERLTALLQLGTDRKQRFG